jgi:sugar-specific transcriptional regulator TrmB
LKEQELQQSQQNDIESECLIQINGKQAVVDKIIEMINNAKSEVLMTMRYVGTKWGDKKVIDQVIFPDLEKAIKKARESNVTVMIIANLTNDTAENLEKMGNWGATVRSLNQGYLRFVVVDKSDCLFATSVPYTENLHFYKAVSSANPILVRFYDSLFRTMWLDAKEVGSNPE